MAIQSYFFNAVESGGVYDRVYNADDFCDYLDLLVGNGVFPNPSTNLQVMTANNGMNILVKAGSGWINGHKMVNTSDLTISIDAADVLLNRIDRVIFYVDNTIRDMGIEVLKGTLAQNPVAPELTRTAERFEMSLATIAVNKQITSITQSLITDTRGISSVCGFVQGLIQQIDTTTLFAQFQSAFESWFADVKEQFVADATVVHKLNYVYTTTQEQESIFDVTNYIPNYAYTTDILEIRINGLCLTTDEYTQNGSTITLNLPIAKIGTVIEFVVYKSEKA